MPACEQHVSTLSLDQIVWLFEMPIIKIYNSIFLRKNLYNYLKFFKVPAKHHNDQKHQVEKYIHKSLIYFHLPDEWYYNVLNKLFCSCRQGLVSANFKVSVEITV